MPAHLFRRPGRAFGRSPEGRQRLRHALVGVGLLYQKGYFHQYLNPDGWQQERYPINDFYTLPVRPVNDAAGEI